MSWPTVLGLCTFLPNSTEEMEQIAQDRLLEQRTILDPEGCGWQQGALPSRQKDGTRNWLGDKVLFAKTRTCNRKCHKKCSHVTGTTGTSRSDPELTLMGTQAQAL